jgi:hypothetical protein
MPLAASLPEWCKTIKAQLEELLNLAHRHYKSHHVGGVVLITAAKGSSQACPLWLK